MGVNITSTSAPTYVPISTQTLLSSASTINFNSIPGTYTDLVLVINTKKTSGGAANPILTFNSGSSGSGVRIYSYGSATGTSIDTSNLYVGDYSTTFSQAIVHIQNYANSTTYKPIILRGSIIDSSVVINAASYNSTSPITQMSLGANATAYDIGSTFNLYGILAA